MIGDLNRNGQLQNQPTGTPDDSSVILRVQQSGSPHPLNPFFGYCSASTSTTCVATPPDCPAGQSCVSQVARYYAYGVRNSFGLALDPVTGALWDTENGPTLFDEVNRVAPGFDSGWNQIMGPDARDPQGVANLFNMPGGGSTYSDPEFSWQDTVAPTAIFFPVGSVLGAAYDDVALVDDVNLGNLYRLRLNAARTAFDLSPTPALRDLVADNQAEADLVRIGSSFSGIVDLELGPDGAVYVVSIGEGTIFRIAQAPPPPGLTCLGWPVTIVGTNAAGETIRGTPGDDVIHGLGGNDLIFGFDGNDVICGGSGNDTIYAGRGDDRISGDAGIDRLFGGSGDDSIEGGTGKDKHQGEDGSLRHYVVRRLRLGQYLSEPGDGRKRAEIAAPTESHALCRHQHASIPELHDVLVLRPEDQGQIGSFVRRRATIVLSRGHGFHIHPSKIPSRSLGSVRASLKRQIGEVATLAVASAPASHGTHRSDASAPRKAVAAHTSNEI